jgi:hypothetical protein
LKAPPPEPIAMGVATARLGTTKATRANIPNFIIRLADI